MEKKYTVTLRLSYQQYAWLGALCRRSKQTQSEVIRSLIENGSVRERITQELRCSGQMQGNGSAH